MKKLETFDLSYFIGKSHFEEDHTHNYLVFQPMYRYFKIVAGDGNDSCIYYWQSKGLSDQKISSITASNYSVTPNLSHYGTKTRAELRGSCLKQDKVTFNHQKVINIYIVYELDQIYIKTSPALVNRLFGAVSQTKNTDIDKYKYSGYGIGLDRGNVYSVCNGSGRNVIIFGADMSSSVHVDKKGKDSLILGKDPTQR